MIFVAACTSPDKATPGLPEVLRANLEMSPNQPLTREGVAFELQVMGGQLGDDISCHLDLGVPGVPPQQWNCAGPLKTSFPVPGDFVSTVIVYEGQQPILTARHNVTVRDCNTEDIWDSKGEVNGYLSGWYIGAGGCVYDPNLYSIEQVPPIMPLKDPQSANTVWNINGFSAPPWKPFFASGLMADSMGAPVIVIYNPTGSAKEELASTLLSDKLSRQVSELAVARLARGDTVTISGASQGAIHIRKIANLVIKSLEKEDISPSERSEVLERLRLQTMGGVGWQFPEGPRYIHYVNRLDPIANYSGMGSPRAPIKNGMVVASFSGEAPSCSDRRQDYDDGKWSGGAELTVLGLPELPSAADRASHEGCVYSAYTMDYETVWKCAQGKPMVEVGFDQGYHSCLPQ